MNIEYLRCNAELQPFFYELPMPKGLNGKENDFSILKEILFSSDLGRGMEVLHRMQDLHDAMNSGRFFLCIAQRSEHTEFCQLPIKEWANNWIKSQYIESSIQAYNTAFDLYLQVNWLYFELYKYSIDKKVPHNFSKETLPEILKSCKYNEVMAYSNRPIMGETIYNAILTFKSTECQKEIHDLCLALKHRQRIQFEELSQGKHPLYVNIGTYNSQESLLIRSIPNVISSLKDFHKELSSLCETSLPFWTFESEKHIKETI